MLNLTHAQTTKLIIHDSVIVSECKCETPCIGMAINHSNLNHEAHYCNHRES